MAKTKTPPIDFSAAVPLQTEANRAAAVEQAGMNRYTQTSAAGDTNVWGVDPETGVGTNTTTMGPQQQAYYDSLMRGGTNAATAFQNEYYGGPGGAVSGGGGGGSGGGGFSFNMPSAGGGGMIPGDIQKDLDYSKLTAMPTTDPAAARQEAQDALYKRNTQYLDPQFQQKDADLRSRLANQGLVPGTAGYNRAYANAAAAQEQAYTGARQDAIAGGGAEAQRAQEMALQLRNQGITEAGNLGAFHNAAQGQGADQYLTQRGQDVGLQGTLGAAGINAGASMANNAANNAIALRQQKYAEAMGMGKQAQDFLPQFGTSQGNVGAYKPGDYQTALANQGTFNLANVKPKKPGIVSSLLPVAGSVLGSFAGPLGTAAGGALGKAIGGGNGAGQWDPYYSTQGGGR